MKNFRRVMSLVLSVLLVFAMVSCATTTEAQTGELVGKTVILHTNDVHGAVEGYAYIPTLKAEFEAKGADVVVVDAGDFIQGSIYVSSSKGATAVQLMNAAGYDVVTLGNHELDYGLDNLKNIFEEANFTVVCSSLFKHNRTVFDNTAVVKTANGLRIGFFGLQSPETKTKVNPNNLKGLKLADVDGEGKDIVKISQKLIDRLNRRSDVVISLAHLGVDAETTAKFRDSSSVFDQLTGWDFVIDGHSHTVMTEGLNGEAIQSTGTAFANIGVIVIDNATATVEDNYLVSTATIKADPIVLAKAKAIEAEVDTLYGSKFAETEILLKGEKPQVRGQESNLGNLITDAMRWKALGALDVDEAHTVAVTNGGGIRATVHPGDVTMSMIKTVLPFGNYLGVVYVTGAELLESLEASTYCTPEAVGGFPQVSGIKFTINTKVAYDQGDYYEGSTYFAPKSIKRVTIESINGLPFDPEATYAVVTNDFCCAGGDTYGAYARAYLEGRRLDLDQTLDEVVIDYIRDVLGGKITDAQYGVEEGRITIL